MSLPGALRSGLSTARPWLRDRAADLRLLPLLQTRHTDVCCCGISKTGTHSMAGLFQDYRAQHHPDSDLRLEMAIQLLRGGIDEDALVKPLRRRDRVLWLEMESSTLAGILVRPLARACPRKRFILTIRDVRSWCDSWLDHNLNNPPARSRFAELDEIRLRPERSPTTAYDRPLSERGFFSLAAYFRLWADHTQQVLDAVDGARLLVVRTHELLHQLPAIASFADVPADSLRVDLGRQFVAPRKHQMLAKLDPTYVRDTAEEHCGQLMGRFFPELSLDR